MKSVTFRQKNKTITFKDPRTKGATHYDSAHERFIYRLVREYQNVTPDADLYKREQ